MFGRNQQGGYPMTQLSRIALSAGALIFLAGAAGAAAVAPPSSITSAGKINVAVGSDIDIGTEIANRFGVKPEFKNTAFSAIIPSLQAKQCDAIISQLFDKPKRREVVDFVDYMYSSEAFLVPKGNPKNIRALGDISGLKVAVENGTT